MSRKTKMREFDAYSDVDMDDLLKEFNPIFNSTIIAELEPSCCFEVRQICQNVDIEPRLLNPQDSILKAQMGLINLRIWKVLNKLDW